MKSKTVILAIVALSATAIVLSGCSGGGAVPFTDCGDGHVDAGEQCDDGNLDDNDDCLSTCVTARCGDTFVDSRGAHHEDCDGTNLNGQTCFSLGFNPGVLSCTAACNFDTSSCPLRPTSTPTNSATPTSTPTPTPIAGATITPTAAGCAGVTVTVSLVYDPNAVPELAGLTLDLHYPASVAIPGSGADDSVTARVTDVSGAGGFASVFDLDTDDGQDDQLLTAYASSNNIPAGPFEEVQFDCVDGAMPPLPAAFTCSVSDSVDSQANPVNGVGCSIGVALP